MQVLFKFILINPALSLGLITSLCFIFYWHELKGNDKMVGLLVFCYFSFDAYATYLAIQHTHNQWLYNVAINIEVPLQIYIYWRISFASLKILITGLFVFVINMINLFFGQGLYVLNTFSYIPSLMVISLFSFMYLKTNFERIEENPFNNFLFWFSAATLFDSIVSIPTISLLSWFAFIYKDIAYKLIYLNKLVYSLWFLIIIIGLVWTSRQRKLLSL